MRALFIALCCLTLAGPALAGSTTLARAPDGHWWAEAKVNGRSMRMLVDTGATFVALTPEDARTAGIDVRNLKFDVRLRTAAGETRGADVMLEKLDVGSVRVRDVPAVVIAKGLPHSLLGQSCLQRLERWQVNGAALTLRD
jgi:aspartyl protease family protein